MNDLISRQAATKHLKHRLYETAMNNDDLAGVFSEIADNRIETWIEELPSAEPEITPCCKCGFWDRDTLRHQFNDFRDWNEAECLMLAERDPYHEINRYTEADDFCSYAERRTDESD